MVKFFHIVSDWAKELREKRGASTLIEKKV